jgi:hypothetical protein
MTASAGTVNGAPCTRMRMQLGSWGAGHVDADLTEPDALAGAVTVQLADVTAKGTVIAGGVANGRAAYRIVLGAAGWATALPAKGYHNDAGVKAALVLADAARACGETLGAAPATLLGPPKPRRVVARYQLQNPLPPPAWYMIRNTASATSARPTPKQSATTALSMPEPNS